MVSGGRKDGAGRSASRLRALPTQGQLFYAYRVLFDRSSFVRVASSFSVRTQGSGQEGATDCVLCSGATCCHSCWGPHSQGSASRYDRPARSWTKRFLPSRVKEPTDRPSQLTNSEFGEGTKQRPCRARGHREVRASVAVLTTLGCAVRTQTDRWAPSKSQTQSQTSHKPSHKPVTNSVTNAFIYLSKGAT